MGAGMKTRIEMPAVGHVCGCEVDELGADVQHGSRSDASDASVMRSFYVSVYEVEEVVCLFV